MTKAKRWPNHAEWAREDSIARMNDVTAACKKLLKVLPNPAMKMVVMEIQLAAQETITALTRAKDPDCSQGQCD